MIAAITIDMDPSLQLGPISIAWHGLMIAVGVAVAAFQARRYGAQRGLDADELLNTMMVAVLSGIAGSRLLYLIEHGELAPANWLGTRGFSIYGGVLGGALGALVYMRVRRLGPRYIDAIAAAFPLGLAIGRVGDLISGEHHGEPTSVAWGVRYLHPDAEVPRVGVAYQSGALYEIVLGLLLLVAVLALARRLERPLEMLWLVIGGYGAGRFVMFFFRTDSETVAAGLSIGQWLSIALVAMTAAGTVYSKRRWPTGGRFILR